MTATNLFHPTVSSWLAERFSAPTAVQSASWPLIAQGQHVLITAPTGSGKTLTAFLWSLNRFATGESQPGHTRVLYVSPLKALNNDIRRNLLEPLQALEENPQFPSLRARTRSGDTPQSERQRMLRQPPEFLITTPESLFLLLTSRKGREALTTVETVIVDEVHSIVDNRRGVQLMVSLERLVDLAGEFQRVALSATVRPLDRVADYVGGYDAAGTRRQVSTIDSPQDKDIRFRVRFPQSAKHAAENGEPIWDPLAEVFRQHIDGNTATLFFTNSRRLAEKITLKINEPLPGPLAYAHHGSLARDIRTEVESRLKAGDLKAIVATSSLEMGIDIGALDEVVMVQAPSSIAATLQRIGRAGHGVGETSVGTLYPTHAQDFLEAAVLAEAVSERAIEPLAVMHNALDVLAQIIVSCCAQEPWPVDRLYSLVTRATPYRNMPRSHFDLVIEMLAGRYAGSRVRELKPRISYDRMEQTIKAHKSALFALYNSGGTIPDRGYYKLRHADSGALIGELDEEFVWEARVGQTFSFSTQDWQVQRITHNDVLVRQAPPGTRVPPFWRSETFNRSFHFSMGIARYLETAEEQLARKAADELESDLQTARSFDDTATAELSGYLQKQREHTGASLPHRHHVLLEHVHSGPGGYRGPDDIAHLVIHTFWGGRLNRPWALALAAAWVQTFGTEPEIHADNNAISIQLLDDPEPAAVLALVTPANLQDLLRQSLEGSGFFGARFRECAGRALLLTRQRFNERLPLWMSRLQAKKLMSKVREYSDFPVLLECWRTCLEDEFDLPALRDMLAELQAGVIRWTYVNASSPSPFASTLTFDSISRYMYADDTPERGGGSSLSDELIAHALADDALRPKLRATTVTTFIARRQRLLEGYAPQSAEDWEEWLKERILIPATEIDAETLPECRSCWVGGSERRWLTHPELLHGLADSGLLLGSEISDTAAEVADTRSAEQFALEVLSYYGPLTPTQIDALLPRLPAGLLDEATLICGQLMEDDERIYYCDSENFEILMRFQRALSRPEVTARPAGELPAHIARWQRCGRALSEDTLADALLYLRGYAAPVDVWLKELLAARFVEFADHHLDQAITATGLTCYGAGPETITFGYPEDADLLLAQNPDTPIAELFTDPHARYGFLQLADRQTQPLDAFNTRFWETVWAGNLVADSLAPLRQGASSRYQLSQGGAAAAARSTRRSARRLIPGWGGNWSLRNSTGAAPDALTAMEDDKERARLLLDRYGFACRELANREGGSMRWARICKALFAMELSGEIVSGYFFEGLSGPQFMTPAGLQVFQNPQNLPTFWVNALDPVAPCGLGLAAAELPARRPGNHLSYHEGQLALVSENNGRRLTFQLPPEHSDLPHVCAPLLHLVKKHRRIAVETVNDEPTNTSPYLPVLSSLLKVTRDHKYLYFEAR